MNSNYLKQILAKHDKNYQKGLKYNRERAIVTGTNAINAMKEVWCLAIDECIKNGKITIETVRTGNSHINLHVIDKQSLENLKTLIK